MNRSALHLVWITPILIVFSYVAALVPVNHHNPRSWIAPAIILLIGGTLLLCPGKPAHA